VVIREAEEDALNRLADRVRTFAPGVRATARNLDPDGPFAETFTTAVAATGAELVVVATHGRGPFGRFLLGGVADELVRHSPAPVLVLRPRDAEAVVNLASRPKLDRLVIALDGSARAERIVEPAVRLGKVFGAGFTLALVMAELDDAETAARIAQPDLLAEATPAERVNEYLARAAKSIRDQGGTVKTELVWSEDVPGALLDLAGGSATTGIALATHGRSGVGRLLHGSVTDDVIRRAAGPVLAFHPVD
jgi:nucleotide-binding universal stress UspA family protein